MLQSKLFGKTKKMPPKDAETVSHKFLVQGGFIDKLMTGVYSFLPLGFKVLKKIENIIREEMNAIGGQEVLLPAVQPKEIWQETGRWDKMEPPLFKFKDIHKRELSLGSTHEEVITDLARKNIKSYKDLPLALYQIQNKFRNEIRSAGGLLRVREFIMKDLYSFHKDKDDLNEYFKNVVNAYKKIFKRCNLDVLVCEATSGSIGGGMSREFMLFTEAGEDTTIFCSNCGYAANLEAGVSKEANKNVKAGMHCIKCGEKLEFAKSIECGHAFKLGTEYSEKMGAFFVDLNGKQKPIIMGCYGIGLGRLMASIIEMNHDKNGIIWPKLIAPFDVHLIALQTKKEILNKAKKLYYTLQKENINVLFDDRENSVGEKLYDADLIGIPRRLVISEKTVVKGSVEFKLRKEKSVKLIKDYKIFNEIKG